MMAYEMFSPVWIATAIVPFLYPGHLPFGLGNQRGIYPRQICSIDKELALESFSEQLYKTASGIIDVPMILRQEPFPTGDMPVHKEASSSDVCHAFTCLAKKQESQHKSTKVDEIVGCKRRSKYANIVYNSRGKESIHRFSFLVESFSENLNILLSRILFQRPQKVQKYSGLIEEEIDIIEDQMD
jgi:hypothetical protein